MLVPDLDSYQYNETKLNFSQKVKLKTRDTWITTPKHVMLTANDNSFSVRVDPDQLTPGHVWNSSIDAWGEEGEEYGAIFSM